MHLWWYRMQYMFSTLRIVAFSQIGVDVAMIKPVRVVNPFYAEMLLCWFRIQCHRLAVVPLLRIWQRVINPFYVEILLCWFWMQYHRLVVLPLLRIWHL